MREIKFRAWDSISKEMWTPDFVSQQGLAGMSLGTKEHPNDVVYDNERFPLMQYTGLKDKNGKEIYEGDILIHEDFLYEKHKVMGVMVWDERAAGFAQFYPLSRFEVIGNIYENPELLKEK